MLETDAADFVNLDIKYLLHSLVDRDCAPSPVGLVGESCRKAWARGVHIATCTHDPLTKESSVTWKVYTSRDLSKNTSGK